MEQVVRGQHIRPLDGLRGLAVLCVVVFHLNQRPFTGGYLGVDLFFVLSGFLITSLLIEEYAADGKIALGRFYARRAKRLFPALAACLVATSLLMVVMGHWRPDVHASMNLDTVREAMLASIFYVQNWIYPPVLTPVTHMWSLSVEEQFYVVWPLAVVGLVRVSLRWSYVAVGLASVAGLVGFAVVSSSYLATFSRGGELLAGALLAFVLQRVAARDWFADRSRWLGPMTLLTFLIMTQTTQVGGLIRVPPQWMFDWGFALATTAIVGLIGTVVSAPHSSVGRIFSSALLVRLGWVSYGLYVYHWAIFFYLTPDSTGWDWRIVLLTRIALAVLIAVVSYRYFEVPLRRARYGGWRRLLAPTALGLTLAATLIATVPRIGAPYSSPPVTAEFRIDSQTTFGANDVVGTLSVRPDKPIRKIEIVGDVAMARIAMPLIAALANQRGLSITNDTNSAWGLTASGGTPKSRDGVRLAVNLTALGIQSEAPDLVVLSSTLGDFPTASVDVLRYRRALERLVSLVLNQPQRPSLVLVLAPQPTLDARSVDTVTTIRVNRVMKDLAKRWPGRVVSVGSSVITNGSMTAPTFGPPNDRPHAATSEWVRWRPADGVAVCQPAVVRQAAMILHVLSPLIPGPYSEAWWAGSWVQSPLFRGSSPCLSNHP